MNRIRTSHNGRLFIAAFAAVLIIRSLGLLALFQHKPIVEGMGTDKHYAKKVLLFKKDFSFDVSQESEEKKNFFPVSVILQPRQVIHSGPNLYSNPLRAPPALA